MDALESPSEEGCPVRRSVACSRGKVSKEVMRYIGIPVPSRDMNKNRHVVISLDVCVLGPGRLHKAVRGYTAEQMCNIRIKMKAG